MASDSLDRARAEVQVDDERVRVTRWTFAPGAETGWHRHEWDYVIVPVTDGRVRIVAEDGNRHADFHTGVSYARPAGVEHNVINAGDGELSFVEVEMKRRPDGDQTLE